MSWKVECVRQTCDDRVLRLQQIGAGRVELFGPEVSAAAGVDELGVDPHLIAARLHRALQHIAYAQVLADRLGVDRLALVGRSRVVRDDEGPVATGETGGQFIGERVDEVVLPRIARQVGEGQHDDRKTRRLGGRLRGDACGPVRIEEPPRAARDHNQQRRERGGERREPETPLLRRGRCGRHGFRRFRRLRLGRDAHLQRIGANRPSMFLSWVGPRSVTSISSLPLTCR